MDEVDDDQTLTVAVARDDSTTATLSLVGEIDMAATDALRAAIAEAVESGATNIVFDMSAVGFMDSSGIGALLESRAHSSPVKVRSPSPAVRRLIDLTGLQDAIEVID